MRKQFKLTPDESSIPKGLVQHQRRYMPVHLAPVLNSVLKKLVNPNSPSPLPMAFIKSGGQYRAVDRNSRADSWHFQTMAAGADILGTSAGKDV